MSLLRIGPAMRAILGSAPDAPRPTPPPRGLPPGSTDRIKEIRGRRGLDRPRQAEKEWILLDLVSAGRVSPAERRSGRGTVSAGWCWARGGSRPGGSGTP